MSDQFFDNSFKLCRSIISQRFILLSLGKSKITDADKIITETEDLNNEFKKYSSNKRMLAYFLSKNYEKLIDIIPHNEGYESRIQKLRELYLESKTIIMQNN